MASIILTPKDIFDQEFKTAVRGYSKQEVDEFLDDVIKDYETYAAMIKELKEENARLKSQASKSTASSSTASHSFSTPSQPVVDTPPIASATNFDILRRLNRLEKEVFGRQILDSEL